MTCLHVEALEDRLTPSLTWAGEFPVGQYPQDLATGDFNNDGNLDLATANQDGTVSVLLGNGLGGFGEALQSAAGTRPQSLAVADFNNDGKLDLAVITQAVVYDDSSSRMSVLLGNGDGTFRAPTPFGSSWVPASAAAGDFNDDGNIDLVSTSYGVNGGWGSVEVRLGDGRGGFAAPHQYQVNTHSPEGVTVADLNADGRLDVVTTNPSTVSVLLGNGDGTLSYDWSASNFTAGPQVLTVAVGDFTSDGIPDLVNTSTITPGLTYYTQAVNVLPGRGDGTFAAQIQCFAGYNSDAQYFTAADFDGDGNLDVFTVDFFSDSGEVSVLLGRGNGTFDSDQLFGGYGTAVVGGDFNADGRPDVAVANFGTVSIGLNDGDWGGPPPPPPGPSIAINDVTVMEGNAGTVAATFTVTLSAASTETITVAYATGYGTATAGSDYQAASGTLTFAPGETCKTITVLVNGDRLAEPNETFFVNLSPPTNASIAKGQGVGTILDDEPRISISDVTKAEGRKNHTTLFTFTVTLSAAYDQAVTISYQTTNGTATTGDGDYVAKTGTLSFVPGETTKTITIEVKGDSKKEADETFYLDLFGNSGNSLITKNRGVGTILNDD